MINEKIGKLIHKREFVYLATSDLNARPNVSAKFLAKVDKSVVYLVDYVIGKTWENLQVNPRVAFAFMDMETLTAYQMYGAVTVLTAGQEFNRITSELAERKDSLTVERVLQGVRRGKKHDHFEVNFPANGAVYKMKVEEVVEVVPTGKLTREKI